MMEVEKKADLAGLLDELLQATQRLRVGLLCADQTKIMEAVQEQQMVMERLATAAQQLEDESDRKALFEKVLQVKAINRCNRALSDGALRVIRSSMREVQSKLDYGPDGTTTIAPNASRVNTSL